MAGYNLVATIISILWIMMSGGGFYTKKFHLHFVRALLATSAYFIYFHAITITSLANALAMGYMDAVLTCIFSYIFLKEHIHRIDVVKSLLSFVGAMMIIRPDADVINFGAMLAGISATLWAFSNVVTKTISKTDSVMIQLFYSNLLMCVFFIIISIYENVASTIITKDSSGWVLILGIMASMQAFPYLKPLTWRGRR